MMGQGIIGGILSFYLMVTAVLPATGQLISSPKSRSQTHQPDWERRARQAIELFTQGQYAQAAQRLEALLVKDPQGFPFSETLAQCYARMGQRDRALVYFHKALDERPDNAGLLLTIGRLYFEESRFQEAVLYLDRARQYGAPAFQTERYLGYSYWNMGQDETALSFLLKAHKLSPKDPQLNAVIGNLYVHRDEEIKAAPYLFQALEADPSQAMVYMDLAHYYVRLEKFDEARGMLGVAEDLFSQEGNEAGIRHAEAMLQALKGQSVRRVSLKE